MKKIFFPFVFLMAFSSCQQKYDRVTRELTIKSYYPQDSIILDTLFFDKNLVLQEYSQNDGIDFLHEWDSMLSRSGEIYKDSLGVNDSLWFIVLERFEINFKSQKIPIVEYLAIMKNKHGEFDNYGVFVQGLGTVHFRGYHSKKPLSLSSASSPTISWISTENIDQLVKFIDDSLLYNNSLLPVDQNQIDNEIEEEVILDLSGN